MEAGTIAEGSVAAVSVDRSPERRGRHWPDVCLWFGVWLPFVVVAAVRTRINWFPIQDQAVLDMRLRGLLHGHDIPLVGAFSRFGWSHPGPIWFYALAPFRALGGTDGLLAGSLLLFGAGIATLPVLVRRRYGTGAASIALLCCIPALMGAGWFTILLPWNPHLAFAWLPAFLVLALSSISRRPNDLGPAIFLGSVLVQLHVGYLAIVVAPLVFVLAVVLRREGREELRARIVRARAWLIAGALLYVPPLIEQIQHGAHGNFGKLAKFFVAPSPRLGGPAGVNFAAGTLAGVLRWPLAGLGGAGESTDFNGNLLPQRPWMIIPVVVLVGVVYALALRVHDHELRDALAFVIIFLAASFVSVSRVIGERWPYLFTWRYAVMWFAIGVVLVGAARLLHIGSAHVPSALGWIALVTSLALFGFAVVAKSVTAPYGHLLSLERPTEELTRQVLATTRSPGPVRLVHADGFVGGVADGLMNGLDDHGWHVGADPQYAYKYGAGHVVAADRAAQSWYVTETSAGSTLTTGLPGARVVAAVTPLSPSEDRELARLQRQFIARMRDTNHMELLPAVDWELAGLAAAGHMDTTGIDVNRLDDLNAKVARSGICRCAVTAEATAIPADRLQLALAIPKDVIRSWR